MHEAVRKRNTSNQMDTKNIVEKLARAKNSEIVKRCNPLMGIERHNGIALEKLPEEMVWLIRHYEKICLHHLCDPELLPRKPFPKEVMDYWIFEEGEPKTYVEYPRNAWTLNSRYELDWWPNCTVNQGASIDPEQYPYFDNVWQIGENQYYGSGRELVVDLHPGPRFGYIGWVTQTDIDYGGGAIVIAKSFFEWLERTLDHGPHAERPYWRETGFKDYGPLIPDDPYYKPA